MKFLLQWIRIFCAAHTKQRAAGVNSRFGAMMNVRCCAAEGAVRNRRMVHEIILFIHDRACAADEQQRIAVVQLSHLVRCQQLLATMSSDELKKDKQHQRKISFTALAFFYYIIVIKAPT